MNELKMIFCAAVKIVNNIKTELSYVATKEGFHVDIFPPCNYVYLAASLIYDDTYQSISTTQHLLAYISTQQTTA